MLDDVGTSCATTNATPETSFAPRHRVDAPTGRTGNRPCMWADALITVEHSPNAPVHSPYACGRIPPLAEVASMGP